MGTKIFKFLFFYLGSLVYDKYLESRMAHLDVILTNGKRPGRKLRHLFGFFSLWKAPS